MQDLVQENLRSDWRGVAAQSHMALKKSDLGRRERRSMTIFQVVAGVNNFGKFAFRWKGNFPIVVRRCVCFSQEESVASIRDKPIGNR
jgi:hypothetical protein